MNFERLLPIAAPAPAGVVIAAQVYREVYGALGAPAASDPWTFWPVATFSVIAAAAGCFAMIGCEMQAYRYAFVAVAEGEHKAAFLAFVLALFCTGLVVWSVGTKDETHPLVAAVLVSVVAYVIRAIRDYMARKRGKQAEQQAVTNADRAHELAMEQQRTRQLQADARREKAKAGQIAPVSSASTLSSGHELDKDKLAHARAFFSANPKASARDWLKSEGCPVKSPSTASEYRKAVL